MELLRFQLGHPLEAPGSNSAGERVQSSIYGHTDVSSKPDLPPFLLLLLLLSLSTPISVTGFPRLLPWLCLTSELSQALQWELPHPPGRSTELGIGDPSDPAGFTVGSG